MPHNRRPSSTPAALLLLSTSLACLAATPSTSKEGPAPPVQAELIGALDLSHLRIGSPVLVRAEMKWSGPGCSLPMNAVIQGHIVQLVQHSKTVKSSYAQVVFDRADCDGHRGAERKFTLIALIGPQPGQFANDQDGVARPSAFGDVIASGQGFGNAGNFLTAVESITSQKKQPTKIVSGQVIDLRHIDLSVGAGEDGATIISDPAHNLRLEPGTTFILLPQRASSAAAPLHDSTATPSHPEGSADLKSPASPGTAPSLPAPEPPDQTEICSGACTIVGDTAKFTSDRTSSPVAGLPLDPLGFTPHTRRELAAFDDETTLTFLDANNLLCTFEPHQLRQRVGFDHEPSRLIRAVLIDPRTHTTKRILDWRVDGDRQYLWRLTGGLVLVHMKHSLRLFDANLNPVRAIDLDGPVLWVTSSPSGAHIAIAVLKERHSQAIHDALEHSLPEDPEEDIETRIVDASLKTLFVTTRSSRTPRPALSEKGELRVQSLGHNHWAISEFSWNQTQQPIVTTTSLCRPVLTTPERDLIFAVGCTENGYWYRMLRFDGHPVLKGRSPSNEFQHAAQSTFDGAFAIRVVTSTHSMPYHQPFRRADLADLRIDIYRSTDGSRLASIRSNDFTAAQLGFALSPAADQMALVGSRSILFYPLKSPPRDLLSTPATASTAPANPPSPPRP